MPAPEEFSVLIHPIHPGPGGAGADHGQTHWERAFAEFVRVEQADRDPPVYEMWAARPSEYVNKAPRPVVLVPHSAGTSLVLKWSFQESAGARKVAGAFMVAPSDRDRRKPDDPNGPQGFGRMILERLG